MQVRLDCRLDVLRRMVKLAGSWCDVFMLGCLDNSMRVMP